MLSTVTSISITPLRKKLVQVDYIPKLGTISEIWSVNHKETGEIRAAKIIKKALKSTSTATEMFKSEAKALKQLTPQYDN